ncbi:MAG: hypothetical protein R2755_34310 [Acidimicrobiales bacterium]
MAEMLQGYRVLDLPNTSPVRASPGCWPSWARRSSRWSSPPR